MNVLRRVEVTLVVLSAHGTSPLSDFQILERGILVAARVAELARRKKAVYKHNLCVVPFRDVFQFFNEVYEPKVLDFLPMFSLEKLEIQGLKTDNVVLLAEFMGESPVPIVSLVLDGAVRSVEF